MNIIMIEMHVCSDGHRLLLVDMEMPVCTRQKFYSILARKSRTLLITHG
jgi:hypothetical protein